MLGNSDRSAQSARSPSGGVIIPLARSRGLRRESHRVRRLRHQPLVQGATDWTGGGVVGLMISALCGSIPSWLRKSISICHPRGTTNVSPPSEYPLKLSAPFRPVSPAMSWNRAARAAASKPSHFGSIACPWARADAAPRSARNRTG